MSESEINHCQNLASEEESHYEKEPTRCSQCQKNMKDDCNDRNSKMEKQSQLQEININTDNSDRGSKPDTSDKGFQDAERTDDGNDSDDDYSGGLSVVVSPPPPKKRRRRPVSFDLNKEINKEIEDEIEDQLQRKANKSNLTVANVKSILKHVISNEHIIAMIKKSMRTNIRDRNEGGSDDDGDIDFCYEPKLTRSKTKELLQTQPEIIWPITPIKKPPDNKHLDFINEELPDDSDDEEYRPNLDDLQDQSEEESGRQSVVSTISRTSNLDSSVSQYFENFDPGLLSNDPVTQTTVNLFKVPEENIGQRTRSKLCLSDTPLEAIEKAFIPPDITTDMYDFECDNKDWENFLKSYAHGTAENDPDDDDEADPEYNVLADKEEVDKEELRQDKGVTVTRKELRELVEEIFQCADEYSSDEEEERKVRFEITSRVQSDMKKAAAQEEQVVLDVQQPLVTSNQRLLIEQQMRQHVQLMTQHFLQTYEHPLYKNYAQDYKVNLASLIELAKLNEKSLFSVYNLKPAFELVENWEKYVQTEEGSQVIKHMEKEVQASKKAKKKNNVHEITFHPSLLKVISESDVFMYPLLLPKQPFRCDGPFKVEFVGSEDSLIAIGLEEFSQHIAKNPRWFDKIKFTEKAVTELICQYLMPCKQPSQVQRHIRNASKIETNPIHHYRVRNKAPRTLHYVIPFNEFLKRPPCQQAKQLLPKIFHDYIRSSESSEENKENDNG